MTFWQKIIGDNRNLCEWFTEKMRVEVEWAITLFDLRLGFKRREKWHLGYVSMFTPTTQNFWNGIFTLSIYLVKTTIKRIPLLLPRIGMVIRYSHDSWFEAGIGYLFDRGEFGAKLALMDWQSEERFNPGVNAEGWNEGPV